MKSSWHSRLRQALARPRTDHAARAVVLRDERGELERIEIDAAHVRVRKLGAAGLDVLGDEERALRAAARRIELRARLGRLIRVRARPAVEPRRRAFGRFVRPERRAAKTLLAERVIERRPARRRVAGRSRRAHAQDRAAARSSRARAAPSALLAGTRKLTSSPSSRLATLMPATLPACRHRRTAAHAGIDRAGEMHARVVALLDEAVVGAFDDREAEIERIAHRVEPLAARRLVLERRRVELEMRKIGAVELDDRDVVGDVDREQLQRALRCRRAARIRGDRSSARARTARRRDSS